MPGAAKGIKLRLGDRHRRQPLDSGPKSARDGSIARLQIGYRGRTIFHQISRASWQMALKWRAFPPSQG